jgi:hypothetical protein
MTGFAFGFGLAGLLFGFRCQPTLMNVEEEEEEEKRVAPVVAPGRLHHVRRSE